MKVNMNGFEVLAGRPANEVITGNHLLDVA
jgi:hypothetical protein